MKAIIITLLAAGGLWAGEGRGQVEVEWEREYWSAQGPCYSQIQTGNGDFLLTGGFPCSEQGSPLSFGLVSVVSQGDEFELRQYGADEGIQYGVSIVNAPDGYSLFGNTWRFENGEYDFTLIDLDSNLDSISVKYFGGDDWDVGRAHLRTADGDIVLVGSTRSFGAGSYDFWVLRTDGAGDSLWSRTYGGRGNEHCFSIIELENQNLILGGSTTSFGNGQEDYWVLCINSEGDSLWSVTYGGEYRDKFSSLATCQTGGYLFAGTVSRTGESSGQYWIVRVEEEGDTLWTRRIEGVNYDSMPTIIETNDGSIALAGTDSEGNFLLANYSSEGDSLWSCFFDGNDNLWCNSLIQTSDGGFSLVGEIWHGQAPFPNFYQIKTSPDQNSISGSDFGLRPSTLSLSAYPNPFNGFVNITWEGPINRGATLSVFDGVGREVWRMPNAEFGMRNGVVKFVWNAEGMPAGKYFVNLRYGQSTLNQSITLIK